MNNIDQLLHMLVKHRIQISLHYETCKDQEKNIEVGCLVISKLYQAVIDQ